jgi:hypothetical protein
MSHRNISRIIVACCKKNDISYCSIYLLDEEKKVDIFRLREIYVDLKEIVGDLQEISERHNLPELNNLFHNDIEKLTNIDHDIIKLATRMKEVEK